MGVIISIVNMKGGVGKTTLTVNLATCLAKNHRKRVLVVDLDMQINATLSLIPPAQFTQLSRERGTLKNLIEQAIKDEENTNINTKRAIQTQICQVQGLDLIPGNIELYNDFAVAEKVYSQSPKNSQEFAAGWNKLENRLMRQILQPIVNDYDFILLDFAPGEHLLTRSGILASDFYLIPAKPEPLSVVGIGILEGRIKQLKMSRRSQIELLGLVFTSRGHATKMATQVKERLTTEFGEENIFQVEIPINVAVAEAVDEFKPAVIHAPQAPAAKAFVNLTVELLGKLD